MDDNAHDRLETAMEERRVALRMSWRDVANKAGLSYEGLRAIRRGDRNPTAVTRSRIEEALGWGSGSVARVLAGGEPTVEGSTFESLFSADEATRAADAFRKLGRPMQYKVDAGAGVDFGIGDEPPYPNPRDEVEQEANETWLAAKNLERIMRRQREREWRHLRDTDETG